MLFGSVAAAVSASGRTNSCGNSSDDGGVDEADNQTGYTIDGVRNADLACVLFLFTAQTNDLEASAPPYQDGGNAHEDEQYQADAYGRQGSVDEYQDCRCQEAAGCQGAHAELIRDDAGRQVADQSGQTIHRNHEAQVCVGAAQCLHQGVIEDALKIHRRIDDGRAHRDQNDQRPLVGGRDVFVCHLAHTFCHESHLLFPFSLRKIPCPAFLPPRFPSLPKPQP